MINDIEPLVSIIVITYNSEKYVLETLDSAYNQTYRNIELIISDDYSTDNTVWRCNEWIKSHSNRFVQCKLIPAEKNSGIASNCNKGLHVAQGEWIKFIAGDDVLLTNCITLNIQFSQNSKAIFLHSKVKIINENGIELKEGNKDKFFKKDLTLNDYILNTNIITTPSIFFHKKDIIDIGGFDENMPFLEDCPIIFRLLKSGRKCEGIEEKTVAYRICKNSVSNQEENFNPDFIFSLATFYHKMLLPELLHKKMYKTLFFRYKQIKYCQFYILLGNKKTWKTKVLHIILYPICHFKSQLKIIGADLFPKFINK